MGSADELDELDAFFQREYPRLVGAMSLFCGDGMVAEELAQETLVRVCRRWSEVRQMAAPGAWAHRVAVNLATSHYRRRRAEQRALARHGEPVGAGEDATLSLAVRGVVAQLPKRQRAVLVLRYYLGYSIEESAALLGISAGAVKQLTHRAVTELRSEFPAERVMEAPDGK